METDAQLFSPEMKDVYTMLAICGVLFVLLIFTALRLSKIEHPDPRRKVLLPMLAYFLALLALMGFLGNFWSTFKYPDVAITRTKLTIGGEAYPIPRPHEVRLDAGGGTGSFSGGRVLLVQTKDRRTWAFPEDRYAINDMLRILRPVQSE